MLPIDLPHTLRRDAARQAMRRLGADATQFYMCVRATDHVVRFQGADGVASDEALAVWRTFDGVVRALQGGDVDHLAPFDAFGVVPESLIALPVWDVPYGRFGFRGGAMLNVRSGLEMRGLVALLRTTPGPLPASPAERRAAAAPVIDAFRAAWDAELALAVPAGTLLVGADGALHGDPEVEAWVEHAGAAPYVRAVAAAVAMTPTPGTATGRSDRVWAPAGFLRPQPLPTGGAVLVCEPVTAAVFPDVLVLLTAAQRRVAAMAAAGATTAEIAAALDIGAETVRTHLAAIYNKLGIGSRAELAARVQRAFV